MNRKGNLFKTQNPRTQEPLECLGQTFDSDEA